MKNKIRDALLKNVYIFPVVSSSPCAPVFCEGIFASFNVWGNKKKALRCFCLVTPFFCCHGCCGFVRRVPVGGQVCVFFKGWCFAWFDNFTSTPVLK